MDAMRSFKLALGSGKKKKKQPLAKQGEYGDDGLQHSNHDTAVEVLVSPTRSPDRRKNFLRATSRMLQDFPSSSSFQRVPSGAGIAGNSASSSPQPPSQPPRAHVVPAAPFQDILLSNRGSPQHQHGLEMDIMVQPILSTRGASSTTASSSSSSSSSSAPPEVAHANLKAMALIGFSAFVYSLQTLNVKFLGGHFDSWTSTFFRGLIGTLLCLVHARYFKNSNHALWGHRDNRRMLQLRGLLGGLTIASSFYAVNALDLAEASVIIFTAPLWTAVLSRVCGMSAWALIDTFSAVACLVGMVLVTQPPFLFRRIGGEGGQGGGGSEGGAVLGVMAALLSAVTAAGVNITISRLKGEDASTITLYAMVGSILVAFPGFMYHQVGPKGSHYLWGASGGMLAQLCLTGLLSWGAQMSKTSGLKMCKSLGVLVMRYLDIVFCFIWDVTFLHSALDAASAVGASVIVGGCVVSILKKKR